MKLSKRLVALMLAFFMLLSPFENYPAAGDSDPSSGRSSRLSGATWRPLVYCPSPLELRRGLLQEDCDSASGPEAELSDTGDAGGDSPGGAEA